jgi:hypothetical protein
VTPRELLLAKSLEQVELLEKARSLGSRAHPVVQETVAGLWIVCE